MEITINNTLLDVYEDGTIINKKTGKKQKGSPNSTGYIQITVKGKKILKSHIIATAFIPNPNNYNEINHKDGDILNDTVENLEWCSHSQNQQKKIKGGKIRKIITLLQFLNNEELNKIKEYINTL